MFRQFLMLQWKASRAGVFILALLAFTVPLLVLQFAHNTSMNELAIRADVLTLARVWMPVFPFLAAVTGFSLALTSWAWDHKINHLYPLSLPLNRWEYVLLKFGAGLVVLAIPVLALWAGALIGTLRYDWPEGIKTYGFVFGLRFLLAAVVAYAAAFAFAAGTVRTTIIVIGGFLAIVIGGTLVMDSIGTALGVEDMVTPIRVLQWAFSQWPGPFYLFGGNWMLIDA